MKRWLLMFGAGVVVLGVGLVVVRRVRGGPVRVKVMRVERGELAKTIQVEGTLHAFQEAEILPDVSGKILEVKVAEGDTVRRGDTLLVIDPSEYRARVLELQARLLADSARYRKLRRDLERARRLLEDSLVSPVDVENLESDLRALEAQLQAQAYALEEARAQLAKTVIRAPFSGVVLRVYKEAGDQAIATGFNTRENVLMVLADPRAYYAEVLVDETEMPILRVGLPARVFVTALPGKILHGSVSAIAGVPEDFLNASSEEGTLFPVKIRILHPPQGMFPGMNLRAEILVERKTSVLRLPRAALGHAGDTTFVWKVEGERVRRVPVQVGMRAELFVEVLEGLVEGDTVVVGPSSVQRKLRPGQAVQVEETGIGVRGTGRGRRRAD